MSYLQKHGLNKFLDNIEYRILKQVCGLSNTQAAKLLKIPVTTYRSKLKKHGIRK